MFSIRFPVLTPYWQLLFGGLTTVSVIVLCHSLVNLILLCLYSLHC